VLTEDAFIADLTRLQAGVDTALARAELPSGRYTASFAS
jgi:hypothetical protein